MFGDSVYESVVTKKAGQERTVWKDLLRVRSIVTYHNFGRSVETIIMKSLKIYLSNKISKRRNNLIFVTLK